MSNGKDDAENESSQKPIQGVATTVIDDSTGRDDQTTTKIEIAAGITRERLLSFAAGYGGRWDLAKMIEDGERFFPQIPRPELEQWLKDTARWFRDAAIYFQFRAAEYRAKNSLAAEESYRRVLEEMFKTF